MDGTGRERFQTTWWVILLRISPDCIANNVIFRWILKKAPVYRTRQTENPHNIVMGHTWHLHKWDEQKSVYPYPLYAMGLSRPTLKGTSIHSHQYLYAGMSISWSKLVNGIHIVKSVKTVLTREQYIKTFLYLVFSFNTIPS